MTLADDICNELIIRLSCLCSKVVANTANSSRFEALNITWHVYADGESFELGHTEEVYNEDYDSHYEDYVCDIELESLEHTEHEALDAFSLHIEESIT